MTAGRLGQALLALLGVEGREHKWREHGSVLSGSAALLLAAFSFSGSH
jgi:hypothetical protein